ncbi:GNAT family N-acetyltransferase [Litorilituus lipolyticus]|uniref:GNAT family N-acetyltransferase n=1 Tax=Litorilituus lipolyticus TaxID=2491017 RepID=UPI00147807F6|nr:GNAT family N-acetyltransferase [Litorilituus lipolyticus]
MSFTIFTRQADVSEFEKLKQLSRAYYDENHPVLNDAYLNWIYLENPAGKATLVLVEEEQIYIGVIALIPLVLKVNGKSQQACFAINVLTHPEHRKKSLFTKMIKFAKTYLAEENIWLLGHPNRNALPGWKRQKMQFKPEFSAYMPKFKWPFSSYKSKKITSRAELEALPETFWQQTMPENTIYLENSLAFIAWRYLDAPFSNYTVNLIQHKNNAIGLTISKPFKGPVSLMVHYASNGDAIDQVVRTNRPTLIMSSSTGNYADKLHAGCWKLPLNKTMPFFLSSWQTEQDNYDFSPLTLAVCDL